MNVVAQASNTPEGVVSVKCVWAPGYLTGYTNGSPAPPPATLEIDHQVAKPGLSYDLAAHRWIGAH